MAIACGVLEGRHVRLEPLERRHVPGLAAAAAVDPSIYRWTILPQGIEGLTKYVETAISWREAGTAVPFATVRQSDGAVIGSTRFWLMERWNWPEGHPRLENSEWDGAEIGHTWLTLDAVRTAANTEAKLLMLTQAFERWGMVRVSLCTDARNAVSAAAIERLGAKFEGRLRAHRIAVDAIPRDTLRFSIMAEEWPEVKAGLEKRLARG